jgi:hypothetical protein
MRKDVKWLPQPKNDRCCNEAVEDCLFDDDDVNNHDIGWHMKWSRQPLRIFLKSIVRQRNAKGPCNFVFLSIDSLNISPDFAQKVERMESTVLDHVVRPFFASRNAALYATDLWVLRVFLYCTQGPLTKTCTSSDSNEITLILTLHLIFKSKK